MPAAPDRRYGSLARDRMSGFGDWSRQRRWIAPCARVAGQQGLHGAVYLLGCRPAARRRQRLRVRRNGHLRHAWRVPGSPFSISPWCEIRPMRRAVARSEPIDRAGLRAEPGGRSMTGFCREVDACACAVRRNSLEARCAFTAPASRNLPRRAVVPSGSCAGRIGDVVRASDPGCAFRQGLVARGRAARPSDQRSALSAGQRADRATASAIAAVIAALRYS